MATEYKPLRLLELYSGIGGMRYAMELLGVPHEVVAAVDVNPVVNSIYKHNFGSGSHLQRNIQSFTAQDLDLMDLDVITMSPPCQPFTRIGLKKDFEDARTCSFLHILNVITELQRKPQYLLLENVKGFEESHTRDLLIETLKKCGYSFQEFLLSPSNLGFPNSRLRYYIIATLKSSQFPLEVNDEILYDIPKNEIDWKNVCNNCQREKLPEECQISHFLEDKPESYFDDFLVPEHILLKYAKVFDIVYGSSSHSCCFTKAYGRYSLGTGSIFTTCCPSEVSSVYKGIEFDDTQEQLWLLKSLRLRYFTPREVANLMCFPHSFNIPPDISHKQMYKALGNSVNVFVVSSLMTLLFKKELQCR